MEISQTAEYALRAMGYLATLDDGKPARAPDVSQATGIPVHYLSKVMRRMVVAGLVTSQKGHGGGFVLARAPSEIRFADVISAAGYEVQRQHCAFGWGDCNARRPCPLHPTWSRLCESFNTWAAESTLDEVRSNRRLLLNVTARRPATTTPTE
jgi:Rrf2 family iron-sulfur cluster assembly transcriptional regulator